MRSYESLFIVKPDLEEEEINQLTERFKALLEENGAEEITIDLWGKRKLAYEIRKYNEGFYILFNFKSEPKAVFELERNFKISDDVIRYIVVKLDEK